MDIVLKSKWNDAIKGLYGLLLIKDEQRDPITEVKTASIDLSPHAQKEITAFWDTAGLNEGTYYITLQLHFLGRIIEKQLVTQMGMSSMQTSLLGATGQVVSGSSSGRRDTILTVVVIILIIMNISWFIYFNKRFKRRRKK